VKYYGGGILVCGGSHLLDLVGFFVGRPQRLYATMLHPSYLDYDLLASALLETPHGAVHFEAVAHTLKRIGHHRDGWDERIEINGTQGRLEIWSAFWDQVDVKDSVLCYYNDRTGSLTEYRYGPGSPFEAADAFYLQNIQRETQGDQPITTGYDVDELIATVKRSAETGMAMEVNWCT
jgi:predicted dehydrogenase